MDRLGIDFLSVFRLPPVEFVHLAADLGCSFISMTLQSMDYNPHGYAPFSLHTDAALRRDLIAALAERDVSIALGEGLVVLPGIEMRDRGEELEVMREIGIRRVSTVTWEPDKARSLDQFATLAEMAAALGMETVIEFSPGRAVGDLAAALAALRHVGREDCRLLVDAMHFFRSGGTVADLAAVDPGLIGYIQLCDSLMTPRFATYLEEGMFERMVPGTGALPLRAFLAALPRDRVIGLEVPLRSQAEAGVGPRERLGPVVAAARALLPSPGS